MIAHLCCTVVFPEFQLEEYRRRFAEEGRLAVNKLDDSGELPDLRIREDLLWSPKVKEDGDADYLRRLEEERQR